MVLSKVEFEVLFQVNSFYGTKMSSNPLHGKNSPCFPVVTACADRRLSWWPQQRLLQPTQSHRLQPEVPSPEFPFETSCCL